MTSLFPNVLAEGGAMGHTLDIELFGTSGLFAITMQTLTLFVAFGALLILMNKVASRIATGPESEGNERYLTKGRFAQIVEVMVIGLRDMFIKPQLGDETNKFLPFLLTLFFFIWFNNMIGLIPLLDLQHLIGTLWGDPKFAIIGGTPTGRLGTNAALALAVFLVWNAYGIVSNGFGGWLHHFTGGAPFYIWLIIIPVEIIGAFVKPVALCIRLFANMTAGHVLLAAIILFIPMAMDPTKGLGLLVGAPIGVVSVIAGVLIYFLEIFVGTLQAFVFMFLTTVFIAQMAHHEHHDHADAHDADDEALRNLNTTGIPEDAQLTPA
ncbi:MAG: F0F1 ATP synthase subunit A [Planctomycetota bacterium]